MSLSKEAKELLKEHLAQIEEIRLKFVGSPKSWEDFVKSETTPPVRFKDFYGNEVRKGDDYWWVDKYDFNGGEGIWNQLSGKEEMLHYFSTEQAAKDWIELNRPCLSVQDVVNFIAPDGILKRDYVNELLEIISKKEAK